MSGRIDHAAQVDAVAKVAALAAYTPDVRIHLAEVLKSPMFKASPRSQRFLRCIVEKALDGDFDFLKERPLGTELFGRPSGYDTGEDAIVRVAASDTRKRLLQFYGAGYPDSRVRIDLPPGSYIPSFAILEAANHEPSAAPGVRDLKPVSGESFASASTRRTPSRRTWLLVGLAVALATLLTAVWMLRPHAVLASPARDLPWSALFPPAGPQTDIILSDTNLSALQHMLDFRITLSDYANRHYVPDGGQPLSADMQRVVHCMSGTDYSSATSAISSVMVLRASQIAGAYSSRIRARPARSLQLRDFETDDNFILLGSLSSNPWGALFAKGLDFAFDYDAGLKTEFIENRRPMAGELPRYVPTAQGGRTGRAFGIVAFIRNLNHSGHVLMLAGTTAEATEAAMKLVCKPGAVAALLRQHGIPDSGPPSHFEILLAVDEMAGTPGSYDVVAVHPVADSPSFR